MGHDILDTHTSGVLIGPGLQPRLDTVSQAVEWALARIDALVAIWEIAGEGRDVIETHLRQAFRDLEALNLLGELL